MVVVWWCLIAITFVLIAFFKQNVKHVARLARWCYEITHLIGIGTPLAAGLSRIVENAAFGLIVINWPVFDEITERTHE